ncbi:MAG: addiction module protein [Ferruginibacter sp.]
MEIQYLHNEKGETTAVLVPIEEWKDLTERRTQREELPQWQKDMIDEQLAFIKNHPDQLISMEEAQKELDRDDDI